LRAVPAPARCGQKNRPNGAVSIRRSSASSHP
jgi:hypothetical protein